MGRIIALLPVMAVLAMAAPAGAASRTWGGGGGGKASRRDKNTCGLDCAVNYNEQLLRSCIYAAFPGSADAAQPQLPCDPFQPTLAMPASKCWALLEEWTFGTGYVNSTEKVVWPCSLSQPSLCTPAAMAEYSVAGWTSRTTTAEQTLPAVIVRATSTADVVAATTCAYKAGYKVSVTGRRNQYLGLNVMAGYVVIDTLAMSYSRYDPLSRTLTFGPGTCNGLGLSEVAANGPPGEMLLVGTCPTVGMAGYVIGGGQGDITPYVGLGADQLVEAELVMYDGSVRRVSKTQYPDLFWLVRGGGGGFAAVTEFVVRTTPAPDPTHFTLVVLTWLGSDAVDGAMNYQDWLNHPRADRRAGGVAGFQANATNVLAFAPVFLFLGSWQAALEWLEKSGMLKPPAPSGPSRLVVDYVPQDPAVLPPGVAMQEFRTYAEAIVSGSCLALWGNLRGAAYYLGVPDALNNTVCQTTPTRCPPLAPRCGTKEVVDLGLAAVADTGSPLNRGTGPLWGMVAFKQQFYEVARIPRKAMDAWVNAAVAARPRLAAAFADAVVSHPLIAPIVPILNTLVAPTPDFRTVLYGNALTQMSMPAWNHITFGAPMDIHWSATPIPYRDRVAVVGLGYGFPLSLSNYYAGLVEAATGINSTNLDLQAQIMTEIIAAFTRVGGEYVRITTDALKGASTAKVTDTSYWNYLFPAENWQKLYFGRNYKRMQEIKSCADPMGVFDKPYSVEGLGYCPNRKLAAALSSRP